MYLFGVAGLTSLMLALIAWSYRIDKPVKGKTLRISVLAGAIAFTVLGVALLTIEVLQLAGAIVVRVG
jgi:hypothetical protein